MNQVIAHLADYRRRAFCALTALWLGALLCGMDAVHAKQSAEAALPAWPVVQQYLAAWNAHDPSTATQVLDAKVTYFNTSAPAARQGRNAVGQVIEGLLRLIPDLHWRVVGEPAIHGASVAFEWEFAGSASLPADASNPAVTRPVRLRGASFARVEHGRIVYFADYYNGLAMQKQLAR